MRCFHWRHLLESLWRRWRCEPLARALKLQISLPNGNFLGASDMSLTLEAGAVEDFSVAFVDASGAPAAAPGDIGVTSSDDTIATGVLSADGKTLSVAAVAGKVGSATIIVLSGSLTASIDVSVVAGVATAIVLTDLGLAPAPAATAPVAEVAPAVEAETAAPADEAAPVEAVAAS